LTKIALRAKGSPGVAMSSILRVLVVLLGVGFALQGIGWLIVPTAAAGSLGMPVLDGLGRSTQFGDFAAFFLTTGVTILLGSRPGRERLLYFPAGLLGSAAFGRIAAWDLHGATFATLFIAVELLASAVLIAAARRGFDVR
jgi:hypothetical protein